MTRALAVLCLLAAPAIADKRSAEHYFRAGEKAYHAQDFAAAAENFEIALKELLVLGLIRLERRCADAESRGVATTAPDRSNSERGACRDGEQNADKWDGT